MKNRGQPIKVMMSYTSYPLSVTDWRGRFILELANSLSNRDDTQLIMFGPPGPIPEKATYTALANEAKWLKCLLKKGGIAHLLRNRMVSGFFSGLKLVNLLRKAYKRNKEVDLIHVNWLQNAIPLWNSNTPAVISVLGTDYQLLSKPWMVWIIRSVLRKRNCIIAPNADWMIPALTSHFGDIAEIRLISFGIHPKFYDVKRSVVTHNRKWIVVLRLTNEKIGSLFTWGEKLFNNDDELHLFGPKQENIEIPEWVHYHGPTDPATLRDKWFPISAGLITLSRHSEGRPQIILEAMAAGLPVIASDIAAHKNILQHDITGKLVNSSNEFAEAIEDLCTHDKNIKLGEAAKIYIKEEIGSWDDCAARYFTAYQDLLEVRK